MPFHVYGLAVAFFLFGIWNANGRKHTGEPCIMGGRILQEGIAIVAVNVFVLISGWFSIKPKRKSICSFLFQVAFLQILSYGVFVSAGLVELNKESIKDLMMLQPSQGWFVKAYLLLYILSPVLNAFVENSPRRTLRNVLVAYWAFLIFLGWVLDTTAYINGGYSVVSFVGLYLLARYMRVWKPSWAGWDKRKYMGIYGLCVIGFFCLIFGAGMAGLRHTTFIAWKLCCYVSPLVVMGAMSLLLFFSKWEMRYSKVVNFCGKGCFAVYLLHGLWGRWFDMLKYIDNSCSGVGYVLSLLSFLVVIYFACILVDLLRKKVWAMIESVCF